MQGGFGFTPFKLSGQMPLPSPLESLRQCTQCSGWRSARWMFSQGKSSVCYFCSDTSLRGTSLRGDDQRLCYGCGLVLRRSAFSVDCWRDGPHKSRCKACVATVRRALTSRECSEKACVCPFTPCLRERFEAHKAGRLGLASAEQLAAVRQVQADHVLYGALPQRFEKGRAHAANQRMWAAVAALSSSPLEEGGSEVERAASGPGQGLPLAAAADDVDARMLMTLASEEWSATSATVSEARTATLASVSEEWTATFARLRAGAEMKAAQAEMEAAQAEAAAARESCEENQLGSDDELMGEVPEDLDDDEESEVEEGELEELEESELEEGELEEGELEESDLEEGDLEEGEDEGVDEDDHEVGGDERGDEGGDECGGDQRSDCGGDERSDERSEAVSGHGSEADGNTGGAVQR